MKKSILIFLLCLSYAIAFGNEVGKIDINSIGREDTRVKVSFTSYDEKGEVIETASLNYGVDNLYLKADKEMQDIIVGEIKTRAQMKLDAKAKKEAEVKKADEIVADLKQYEGTNIEVKDAN